MKNIGKNIGLIYSLGLVGALTLGCASTARNYSTMEEAKIALGVPGEFIEYLPNGYKTNSDIGERLKAIAGLYEGKARFKISNSDGRETLMIDGISGSDETIGNLAKVIDENGNFIIEDSEINKLERIAIDVLRDK